MSLLVEGDCGRDAFVQPSLFSELSRTLPGSGVYAAIDFGISNTDTVAYVNGDWRCWTQPSGDKPDPELVRSVLADGGVELSALEFLAVTGGRHRTMPDQIGDCQVISVGEVQAIGSGGQALAELATGGDEAPTLVVSAGSGTAVVAARGDQYAHVTGTGVGGGTLLGLCRLLLGITDPHRIDELAQQGDPNGADLSLGDVVGGPIGPLPASATAVNFGRLAHQDITVSHEDLAAALVTLVGQVIALVAINAARAQQIERIVVIGHLIDMSSVRSVLEQVGGYYDERFILPPPAGLGTALGALLYSVQERPGPVT